MVVNFSGIFETSKNLAGVHSVSEPAPARAWAPGCVAGARCQRVCHQCVVGVPVVHDGALWHRDARVAVSVPETPAIIIGVFGASAPRRACVHLARDELSEVCCFHGSLGTMFGGVGRLVTYSPCMRSGNRSTQKPPVVFDTSAVTVAA